MGLVWNSEAISALHVPKTNTTLRTGIRSASPVNTTAKNTTLRTGIRSASPVNKTAKNAMPARESALLANLVFGLKTPILAPLVHLAPSLRMA